MKVIFLHINIIIALLFIFSGCEKVLIGPSGANKDPEANFEALWEGYEKYYGLFEVKEVDWEAVYQENRSKVTQGTTEKELAQVFKALLSPLNDMHAFIIPSNNPELPARIESSALFDTLLSQTDYSSKVVEGHYVNSLKKLGETIEYGWLENEIGYIHITSMEGSLKLVEENMNTILSALQTDSCRH